MMSGTAFISIFSTVIFRSVDPLSIFTCRTCFLPVWWFLYLDFFFYSQFVIFFFYSQTATRKLRLMYICVTAPNVYMCDHELLPMYPFPSSLIPHSCAFHFFTFSIFFSVSMFSVSICRCATYLYLGTLSTRYC